MKPVGSVRDFRVVSLPEVDSTNTEMRRRIEASAMPGLVITAACQTGGLGRQGRRWISPVGNLYASIFVKPPLDAARSGQLAFAAAVAVADTIDHFLGVGRVQLKWPNDILVDNAKLGGILIESDLQEGCLAGAIIGIGLNIAVAPDNPAYRTTSLDRLAGKAIALPDVLSQLLADLGERLAQLEEGFTPVRTAWESHAWRLGQTVRITTASEQIAGAFTALAEDGALLLNTPDGQKRITAGSLSYEGAA